MKIFYAAFARLPTEKAHGLQIMKTCEAFASEGVDVTLVVPRRKTFIADSFEYYGVEKKFKLKKIPIPDFVGLGFFGFLFSLIFFSERAHFDTAFWEADFVYSRDALVLLQYLLLGRPLVFEAHQKPTFISRIVARRAKKVVVISQALKGAFHNIGVSENRIVVAPDAVDTSIFENVLPSKTVKEIGKKGKVALYAGHLYERKGADIFGKAASNLKNLEAIFIGGTTSHIQAFQKRWGNFENIHVLGFIPPKDVPSYLLSADLLILPNSGKVADSARFSSPMKLFEYMASGVPIIASDVESVREVLDDETAYFFEPDDAKALERKIQEVLDDQDAIQKGRRAKEKVQSFSWTMRAKKILSSL